MEKLIFLSQTFSILLCRGELADGTAEQRAACCCWWLLLGQVGLTLMRPPEPIPATSAGCRSPLRRWARSSRQQPARCATWG